jgi:dCTP deaminase
MLTPKIIAERLQRSSEGHVDLQIVPTPHTDSLRSSQSASVDLRLGCWFTTFRSTQSSHFSTFRRDSVVTSGVIAPTAAQQEKSHYLPFGSPFILHPGQFALGVTLEWLRLPSDLSASVSVRSSLSRHGLMLATATGVHPGFTGCLTLELSNIGALPIEIAPGIAICQLFFHQLEIQEKTVSLSGSLAGNRRPVLRQVVADEIAQKLGQPPTGKRNS